MAQIFEIPWNKEFERFRGGITDNESITKIQEEFLDFLTKYNLHSSQTKQS